MSTLADRLDRFVRWFFNSSPDFDLIQPAPEQDDKAVPKTVPTRSRRAASTKPPHTHRIRLNRIHA